MTTRAIRPEQPETFRATARAFASNVVAALRDVNEPTHRAETPDLRLFWAVAVLLLASLPFLVLGAFL